MKNTLIYRLLKRIIFSLLKFLNSLIPKKRNSLFFFPHLNCKNDSYDIVNNSSDNVLKLCDRILRDRRFKDCFISIMIFDKTKITKYEDYCRQISICKNVNFVFYADRIAMFRALCRASIIFTDNYYRHILYKVKKQVVICLGYFVVPFKDDYIKIRGIGFKKEMKLRKLHNNMYDYHVSTSPFCSRELSVDSLLYYPKYLTLGFPRNDIFYEDSTFYREKLIKAIGFTPRTILSFIPTHRDYEREDNFLYDKSKVHMHSLFGEITKNEESDLNKFLEDENIVIIAKSHPIQDRSVLTRVGSKRIIYFSDLVNIVSINLLEIMAASDILVTDYSTACFDFLLTDRPTIYYFYDYELERKTRTFFIDPITPMCAGDIVYDISGLIDAIKLNIESSTRHIEKRHFVRDLLFYHNDGKSTERVMEFVLELLGS